MEELAARQLSLGGQIQQIISNFKKDSASRKTTTAYYEERLQRIEDISSKFEETDNQIRLLVDVPMDHAYFVKDYYKEITALASQYSSHFKEMIMTLQDVLPPKDLPIQTHSDPPPSDSKTSKNNKDVTKMYDTTPESNVQETTSLNKLIRRQRALLGSLTRLLDALKPKEKEGQTLPHTHQMDELWAEIEKLHYNIWESCDDPISIGYNFNEYISCEKKVNDIRLSSSSIRSSSTTQENATNNLEAIKLPQITIPKFDGNYLAWRQFFDLFSQLVHTQPLPKVQKMWYLKTNLIGEAGNLVRALAVTEDNYDTAWNMLQDRYNDIRVLSSTTIQRLLGQSYNSSSASSIRAFHDTIRECLMSLNNLGITTSSWDPILLYLLLKKLDRPSHILYEQSLKNPKKLPTISEFLSFLEFQFHSLEATSDKNKLGRSCTSAITTHENSAKCIACKDRIHPLHTCNTFLKLTPADRLEFVKRYRLCFNCLKSYHSANMCQSRHCLKCNKRHNTLLHIDDDVYEQTYSATGSSNHEVISNTPVSLSASETFNNNSYVLLSTARIRIIANNGRKIECRAILDSGSQVNLVTDRLVKQLGIQPKHSGISIEGIGSKQKSCRYRVNVKIQSKLNGFSSRLEAFVLPKIVNDQPSLPLNISSWSIPLNIPLADPNFNQPGQIDALLGAEFFHQIFSIGQISLSNNLPSLQNTVFGWIVSGKVKKIDTLIKNFYVDDGLLGSNSLNSAIMLQKELTAILKSAGLELRKWCANHPQLLQEIPVEHQEINLDFDDDSLDRVKTLGLAWLPKEDTFCIKTPTACNSRKRVTKRSVSSDLARIFDPLGIMAPVVTVAKIFMQELWNLKISWDEALPAELHTKWTTFCDQLQELHDWKIPRHVHNHEIPQSTQLHVFVDASEKAYGAVIYLRSVTKDKRVIVRLLCGKSRVSPINRQHQTIARLELCSALLGTQLASRVQKDLNFEGSSIYFWTDSEVVLAWINSTSPSYEVFVANRIAKIQNLSLAQQWRHVGSKSNPADILSRGCDPKNFVRCNMWFFGPLFLHGNDTIWSKTALNENHFTTEEGVKRTKTALITLKGEMENIIDSINHGNSFKKLRRILAYVLRFKNLLRNKQEQRPRTWTLTPLELDASEKLIIRAIQTTEFKDEIGSLKRNNTVKSDSTIYSLHPFLDENGIIRVGGRLNASSLPYENKHQMFLPYNDPLTKLIMQMIHEDNMHCGPTALVSHVRQRFWPIKASIMARSIVHHCVRCFKARPRLLQQVMGDLPSARVTPSRPFINAGVDYCGPFWIHYKVRGKRPTKAYLAIFCCFSTKALHLELVTDLTTGAFIGALKRFTSRRGRCQNIYCDNATNFVGAKNHLQELSTAIHSADAQETIVNMCNDKGIHFHFIPPRAPHFGGLSAKHLLLRSVTTYSLTYEELETVITEVEAILNSRPLSPMSNDPNDLTALTPGHFLIGEPLITPIDANAVERKVSLEARWETVSKIKHEFWRRWSREYLNELQYRHKWQEQVANIEPGAVVILKEDNLPVLKWPLGRIIKVYKGEDNVVRVVDVKTAKGIFQRVINRVAPLPLADNKTTYASDEPRPTDQQETTTVTNEHSVIPHKRRKTSSLTSKTTALLLVMFIMPLVWASGVTNTEFASEIGIHFEGVGQVKISQNNWQLIVYYELKTYWDEIQSFSKGTRALEHLCQEMKQGSTCLGGVLSAIRQIEKEFQIDNSLLSTKRIKRGALNIVGNLANSLFGVLDSEYAQQMSNTIEAVKENEHHLNKLLQNQTSILDTTINILKQDQETIKNKFDDLDLQTTEILARLHDMEDTEYQSRVFNIFISLAMQLTITAANLQRIKSSILDVLTDTHHGKISPILLSPTQLQVELMKIRNYLPSSLQIPVDHDNHLQLYKLMRVEGGLTKNHVIFKISIPLSDQQPYELYKLYPIPSAVNDSLVPIQLCNEILAINPHRDQYFPMSSIMLHSCILTKPDTYLCSNIQSRYNKGSDVCSCEIHLLNNDTNLNCNIERMKTNAMWIQLSNNNQWIYSVKSPKRINTVCARQSQQLTLTGSGLITLQPQCTIKDNSITIQGHQSYTSARYESYTSLGNFKDIVKPQHLTTILQEVNPYRGQLDNLTELQESLARQQTLDLPRQIQNINYHYSIVGYTALSLTIILIMYNLYKIKTNQYRLQSTASQDPTPVPRQRSTSEFVVSTT